MELVKGIVLIGLIILNWIIYHSIFDVAYFNGVLRGIVWELVCCFIAALFELAIIMYLGKAILGFFAGLLKWILIIALIIAGVAAVIYCVYAIWKYVKKVRGM